jgi:hypothetical protein
MAFRDVFHCEAPRCRAESLGSIETLMRGVSVLAVHILETRRDFVTHTPFSKEKFDDGALLLFDIHCHLSVATL